MRKLHPRRFVRNVNQYDLFEWQEASRRLVTSDSKAVRELQRQHGLRPSTARLIAELAGYPREAH